MEAGKPPRKLSEGNSGGRKKPTTTTSVPSPPSRPACQTPPRLHLRADPPITLRHQPPPAGSQSRGKEIRHKATYCMPDLGWNGIEGEDLSTFGLYNWANIRYLDICTLLHEIDGNKIGPVGCGYLSRAEMGGL